MAEGQIRTTEVLPLLLVTFNDQHEMSMRGILDGTFRAMYRVSNCNEALHVLDGLNPSVVLVEADLPTGNWKRLLDRVSDLQRSPEVIVFSRLADVRLWAEVLTLGGYDLLQVPFEAEEVLRTISMAHGAYARKLSVCAPPPNLVAARAATAA
jgi:DNA-binding NtrC family response regulator